MDNSHHGDDYVDENTLNAEELKHEARRTRLKQWGLTPLTIWLIPLFWFFLVSIFVLTASLILAGNVLGLFFGGVSQPLPFLHPLARFGYALFFAFMVGVPLSLQLVGRFGHGDVSRFPQEVLRRAKLRRASLRSHQLACAGLSVWGAGSCSRRTFLFLFWLPAS